MKEFRPLTDFVISDYEGNQTTIQLDMSTSLIKEIKLGEDCGDQTLEIILNDFTFHLFHAGSFEGMEENIITVYKDGVFLKEPSELYKLR
ncbi:MAG: hypothetical protein J6Y28_07885 [Acholeplasmatales bacterium]|nr:hypothetical protein [Acholeplasmatales bacterium]